MVNSIKNPPTGNKRTTPLVRYIFLVTVAFVLIGLGIFIGEELDYIIYPELENVANLPTESKSKQHREALLRPPQLSNSLDEGDERGAAREAAIESLNTDKSAAQAPESMRRVIRQSSPLADYAVRSSAPEDKPVIAIVIDDMGLDRVRSFEMMSLTGPLTVSLMTYARHLPELTLTARKAGHEVMAHLPMEPFNAHENPGPGALFTNMDDSTIRRHISENLDKWQGYVGINNHMGSKFTEDATRMLVVMEELKLRGLMWLDSKTTAGSAGKVAAAWVDVPFVERDVFLDNVDSVSAILDQLAVLEESAKSRGFAIGIGHPYDSTIEALRQWLPTLRSTGIFLVPVTEVLRRGQQPVLKVGAG